MNVCAHLHILRKTFTQLHTLTLARKHSYTRMRTHANVHTQTHTHIHTYAHTHKKNTANDHDEGEPVAKSANVLAQRRGPEHKNT